MKVKVNTVYFITTEKIAFTKYLKTWCLHEHYSVLTEMIWLARTSYTTSKRQNGSTATKTCRPTIFSLLLDGSTDTSNIDNEVVLVVWCDPDGSDEKVHTRMDLLTVSRPQSVTACGLFQVLESSLQGLGIQELSPEKRSL